MKIIWGLLFSLLLTSTAFASDKTLARFAYEEAEAAFQRDDIAVTLEKLDEAERRLGNTNPPILYLRVQARHAQLKKGPFFYEGYQALKKDTTNFLRNHGGNENTLDMSRDVYKIDQEIDARQQQEKAALEAEQRSAESGNTDSIKALISRYSAGIGTPKDKTRIRQWQNRLAAEELKQDVAATNDGDTDAMLRMAQRYETGNGVRRDATQAQGLRTRVEEIQAQRAAEAAKLQAEQAQKAKEAEVQQKIAEVSYFEYTSGGVVGLLGKADDVGAAITMLMTTGPFVTVAGLMTDAIAAPTKITQVHKLKQQATLRAAAWGNPDSLMSRAQAAHQATMATPYRIE